MKYAFIMNPVSGNGKKIIQFEENLNKKAKELGIEIKKYRTTEIGGAEKLAYTIAEEAAESSEKLRIYACGGDGTVSEVVNGIAGFGNVAMGIIPVGSGNDFARNFASNKDFLDVNKLFEEKEKKIDLLKYTYMENGKPVSHYCANGINIGFDGNTAILAHHLQEYPIIAGSFSYLLSVIANVYKMLGQNLRVIADGKMIHRGKLLMCTVSNGKFCGGGIQSCPRALMDDRKAEVLVIKNITRRKFFQIFPKFYAGRFFETKNADRISQYAQAESVTVEPLRKTMQFVVDGEIITTGTLNIKTEHDAITILVP